MITLTKPITCFMEMMMKLDKVESDRRFCVAMKESRRCGILCRDGTIDKATNDRLVKELIAWSHGDFDKRPTENVGCDAPPEPGDFDELPTEAA